MSILDTQLLVIGQWRLRSLDGIDEAFECLRALETYVRVT